MEIQEPVDCLPPGVADRLGYYVYLYIDPRCGKPFYVGKGKGNRVFSHHDDVRDSIKTRTIAEIRAAGVSPRLEILSHGIKDEETAFRIEAAAIDLLDLGGKTLSNAVRGWKSLEMGLMTLDQLVGYYAAPAVTIEHPSLLIRINKLYRHKMSDRELYEATCGFWKLGKRRTNVRFAMAVFEGVVREVYEVQSWHPPLTNTYTTRDLSTRDLSGRCEFVGVVAPIEIRGKYRGRNVKSYFRKGQQSPTVYVNA